MATAATSSATSADLVLDHVRLTGGQRGQRRRARGPGRQRQTRRLPHADRRQHARPASRRRRRRRWHGSDALDSRPRRSTRQPRARGRRDLGQRLDDAARPDAAALRRWPTTRRPACVRRRDRGPAQRGSADRGRLDHRRQPRAGRRRATRSGRATAAARPVDGGGNVESGIDCGFNRPESRQTRERRPRDRARPTTAGRCPVLPISADSPARDLAGRVHAAPTSATSPRPQGALCDAGAYEYMPPPAAREPTPDADRHPTTPTPTPTATRRRPWSTGPSSSRPRAAPSWSSARAATDVRAAGRHEGHPGRLDRGHAQGPRRRSPRSRRPARRRRPPRSTTGSSRSRSRAGSPTSRWSSSSPRCPKAGPRERGGQEAKTRKLWGDGKGAFRTTGKYSAATVRGTKWLVQDSCAGTLTRVTQGSVTVRRTGGGPTRIVRAGKRLLVRPSR